MNKKFSLYVLFILCVINDILLWVGNSGFTNGSFSTFVLAFIVYFSFLILLKSFFKFKSNQTYIIANKFIFYWLLILIISILRGIILAENYWDWKYLLLQSFGFFVATFYYFIGTNTNYLTFILNFFIKNIFLFGLILIPLSFLTSLELYSRVMIPVTFLLIFIPYVNFSKALIIICVTIISVLIVLDFRSLQIKVLIPFLIFILFAINKIYKKQFLLFVHSLVFILPIVLALSAFFFNFNIFKEVFDKNEKYDLTVEVNGVESNLLVDNRTFLYVETISSMKNISNWIFGKGASGNYETSFFGDEGGGVNTYGNRYASEVGILNIFLHQGLLGCLIYMFLIFKITKNALIKSKNNLIKMIAILLAFRWPLSFVEELTQYDLNFVFFWIMLGVISSKIFCNLTDDDLRKLFEFKQSNITFNPIVLKKG